MHLRRRGGACDSGQATRRMADNGLLEAVRGLHLAHPELGPKPLLAKLRQQQPDLAAGNKEVREALAELKAEESKPTAAAPSTAAAPPAAATPADAEARGAPPDVAISLACFGCARLPSEMGDGREKHPVCPICRELKIPTTYWCDVNCPGNPGAWKRHAPVHKSVRKLRKANEDGGVGQQQAREIAEENARTAAQTGDAYDELVAEGGRYTSQQDPRRAARTYREAIAMRPDDPQAYFNLGAALSNSGHFVEAVQRFLEAKERYPVGSELWARATAAVFSLLIQKACAEVAKPEWWSDEGLKALSARVMRAAPDDVNANRMRAFVLRGLLDASEVKPRSAAELREAAAHFDRAAALHPAPAVKGEFAGCAAWCRLAAEAV